jgi:hypothetical protein
MSIDLTDAKRGLGSVHPEKIFDSSPGLTRVEPLLTAEVFKARFLFGIPLRSPLTKEEYTLEMMSDFITRACAIVEMDTKTFITAVAHRQRHPFVYENYKQFIYLDIPVKPIQKVVQLAICSASYQDTPNENDVYPNGGVIYLVPPEWIEMAQATRGILNVNPLTPAFTAIGSTAVAPTAAAGILQVLGIGGSVPGYWNIACIVGWCSENGNIPVLLNEVIGAKAAILLINNLLALFPHTSQSLNIDGLGQSTSNMLYQILQIRLQALMQEYDKNIKMIKDVTANHIMMSNI